VISTVGLVFDWTPLVRSDGNINPTVVITMEWYTKYHTRHEFLTWFLTEQEYIDAEFRMIVMFNFGVWMNTSEMNHVATT